MKKQNLTGIKDFESLSPSEQIHLKGMGAPPKGGDQSIGRPPSKSDKSDTSTNYDSSDYNDKSQSYDNSSYSDTSVHHD